MPFTNDPNFQDDFRKAGPDATADFEPAGAPSNPTAHASSENIEVAGAPDEDQDDDLEDDEDLDDADEDDDLDEDDLEDEDDDDLDDEDLDEEDDEDEGDEDDEDSLEEDDDTIKTSIA